MHTRTILATVLAIGFATQMNLGAVTPAFPTAYQTLTVDGIKMGDALDGASGGSLTPTITFVGTGLGNGTFHMWYRKSFNIDMAGDLVAPITDIFHATSTNGLNFTTTGHLSFAVDPFTGNPPFAFGANKYPPLYFQKIVFVNNKYTILTWTYFDGTAAQTVFGDYSYNISASDIGADPNNLVVTHRGAIGPIPGGTGGQSAGPWGLVNGKLYFENNGFLGRADYVDNGNTAFPKTTFTGPWEITVANLTDPLHTIHALGLTYCLDPGTGTKVYPRNHASVIDNGDSTQGLFFTLRNCADDSRFDKEVIQPGNRQRHGLVQSGWAISERRKYRHRRWSRAHRQFLRSGGGAGRNTALPVFQHQRR